MDCKITCIPGDGIGPEIVAEAKKFCRKRRKIRDMRWRLRMC